MAVQGNITLATRDETLVIDGGNGALVSFRSRHAPDQEFVAHAPDHPAFVIGYLDGGDATASWIPARPRG